jgi:hypothetical protein
VSSIRLEFLCDHADRGVYVGVECCAEINARLL